MSVTAGELGLLRRDYEVAYDHRCTIVRPSGGHAWDSEPSDTAHLSDQPCTYVDEASNERITTDGTRIVRPAMLLLPRTVDVNEGDRVTSVVDQTGETLITNARGVTKITRLPSHIEAVLSGSGS